MQQRAMGAKNAGDFAGGMGAQPNLRVMNKQNAIFSSQGGITGDSSMHGEIQIIGTTKMRDSS